MPPLLFGPIVVLILSFPFTKAVAKSPRNVLKSKAKTITCKLSKESDHHHPALSKISAYQPHQSSQSKKTNAINQKKRK